MVARKVLVIYHRADYDGIFSGIIVKKYYESKGIRVDVLGWNYGDNPINFKSKIGYYQGIILVDLSFTVPEMELLMNSGKLTWIDHHQTSILDSEVHGYTKIPGKREIGRAAVELVWEFYNGKKEEPILIQMAGAYDVWDKNRFNWEDVVSLQYGLKDSYGLSFKKIETDWEDLLDDSEWVQDRGEVIYSWIREISKTWVTNCGIPVTVANKYKGIAIITPMSGSLVFESVLKDYDIFLVVQVREGGTKISISMYSEPDKELGDFSCGEYLKSLNPLAGGHKLAGGGEFDRHIFERLIFDHEI